ncbi:ergothioneine biosynthesis protein EgtB [Sphingomonas sp. SRS2]|uniref:ergothioneine biosynthesis protein EgtB n=1 Tax=Sphingomonas sp. SRS2 TaxID=133190 RepID=UPI0006184D9E|nr:ergothioneine biosynthesis protein EgtB [Sphingomonas sp. SRS2]KKC27250.1 hypothetical protein WP12_04180 [Sphingomonas sp. SRS2]
MRDMAANRREDKLSYRDVRAASVALAAPLSAEDCQMQSMPDASPTKWHLAHTSWFFETFLLVPRLRNYRPFDPAYATLFNSYYVGIGERHARPERGLISRPSLDEILVYREHVDAAMDRLMTEGDPRSVPLIELGLHHEQQHQELILMDIQHAFSRNPAAPPYPLRPLRDLVEPGPAIWLDCPGGLHMIGHTDDGFAFDNEGPRHRYWLEPFAIADRLVTAGEFIAFIDDGGYRQPEYWLADGWAAREAGQWDAPLYWRRGPDGWNRFSLGGARTVVIDEPVLHLSYYEADAYARWAGCRLPTEYEWEVAVQLLPTRQVYDVAWQWTASPYSPYPGFEPAAGAVGEYNGKFMVNQMVLRGGSLATPAGHCRLSYRNFFPPHARWTFSSLRLARNMRGDAT